MQALADQKSARCIKAHDGLSLKRLEQLKSAASVHRFPVMGHVPEDLLYEEAQLPDAQHFFGVVNPTDLKDRSYVARMSDWENVGDDRLSDIVKTSVSFRLINTPTLTRAFHLLKYRNYKKAREEPELQWMPKMFTDVVWHPKTGIGFYRNLSPQRLDAIEFALNKKLKLVYSLFTAGGGLHLGTDSGPFSLPGLSLHQEMRLFETAGIPLEEIWAMATWKAARWFSENKLGKIEAGAPADFLVFSKDPTVSLDNLNSLVAVVSNGKLYSKEALEKKKIEFRKHHKSFIFRNLSLFAAQLEIDKLFPQASH